jgi:hypothetical protein
MANGKSLNRYRDFSDGRYTYKKFQVMRDGSYSKDVIPSNES